MDAVSPLKVLERGYVITRKDGAVVKSVAQVKKNDMVELAFADGKALARVEST